MNMDIFMLFTLNRNGYTPFAFWSDLKYDTPCVLKPLSCFEFELLAVNMQ